MLGSFFYYLVRSFVSSPVRSFLRSCARCLFSYSLVRAWFIRLFSHPFARSYGRALVVSSFVRPFVLGSFSHSLVPLFRSFFSSFVCSFDFSLVILFVISFFRPFLLSFFSFEPSYKEIVKISVNGWSGIPSEEGNCELHTSEKGL